MNRRIVAAAVLLAFFPGCCSIEALRSSEALEEANSTLAGRRATITTVDGAQLTAEDVRVTPESISWMASSPGLRDSMSTLEVESIRVTWRAKAAARSFLFLGGALGLLVTVAHLSEYDEEDEYVGVLLVPLLGTLVGVPMAAGTACTMYDLAPLHTEPSRGSSGPRE